MTPSPQPPPAPCTPAAQSPLDRLMDTLSRRREEHEAARRQHEDARLRKLGKGAWWLRD